MSECGKHDPVRWESICRRPLGHAGLHDWEAPYGPGDTEEPAGFKSTYGQLMTAAPFGLSLGQEAALRELDGIMAIAEHVLRGTPVGAGAHSAICALLMDAYAKGRASVAEAQGGSW